VEAPKRTSPRIQALSSSSELVYPFLSALEAPVHAEMGGGSDAMRSLMEHRIVFLGGEITDLMADVVLSQLILLDAQDHSKDIRLYINSSGGNLK
jgi:ATP-dependent Clp protease, protease subunit